MKVILLAAVLVSATQAMANDVTSCKQGKTERKVSLVYPEAGKKSPCEVHYIKGTDDKVIYQAKAEAGFCEKKAEDFIAKLKSGGFSCEGAAPGADAKN